MLVVQITQNFFTHGGVMKRARQETLALLEAGHKVIVITDLRWKSHMFQFKKFRKQLLILPIKPFYIYGLRNLSSQISFTLKLYPSLKMILKKFPVDIIVSHQSVTTYSISHLAKKFDIPSVLVIQDIIRDRMATGNPYNKLETLLFLHSNTFSFRHMDFIVVVSMYNQKLVLMDGTDSKKVFIKYNAVNTELFKPIKTKSKDIDILFIGRLSVEKGVDILLNSLHLLPNNKNILIIGEGPLRKKLEKQAMALSHHNIKFKGFVDHLELPEYINRAKIVVTPSRSECQASVPIESMACAVPVIASRVSGMEDMISDKKNGWLLNENNPKELGRLLGKILSDDQLLRKTGDSALERAQFFSEKKFYIDIIGFFNQLIEIYKKNY